MLLAALPTPYVRLSGHVKLLLYPIMVLASHCWSLHGVCFFFDHSYSALLLLAYLLFSLQTLLGQT
jgi:hypothetical protein